MMKELQIRFLAFILTFSLVLPMAMSLTHALHHHEIQICMAEGESHIHAEGIDCEQQHFFSHLGDTSLVDYQDPYNCLFQGIQVMAKELRPDSNRTDTISLRGPPMINVI